VTLASQDLCAYPNPVDITASPAANATKPTATAFNTTFTSDENAYYSFANITLVFDIPSNTRKRRGELGGGSGSILNIPSGSSQSYRGVVPRDTIENGFSFEYLPGGFLTIPSSSLQSYRGVPPTATIGNIYSFNFADLYPNHVPVLRWMVLVRRNQLISLLSDHCGGQLYSADSLPYTILRPVSSAFRL